MTPTPHSAGAVTSAASSSATPTSTTSAPANHPPGRKRSLSSTTSALATNTSSTDPRAQGAESLYALGIQAQYVDGELALAAELLGSDDPDQEDTAIRLVEQYLEAQAHTAALLESKADNICRYIDHLQAVAKFRKDQSQRLAELAAADEKRAQSLTDYMLKVLTTLQPEANRFSLPTHELHSRRSEAVEIEDEDLIPDDLFKSKTTRSPDKTAIKAALKGGQEIAGARIVQRTNWTIK